MPEPNALTRRGFTVDWTTIYVGWRGLGVLSPWPERWLEFSPLVSLDGIIAYADDRLAQSPDDWAALEVLQVSRDAPTREELLACLAKFATTDDASHTLNLRKWRCVMLEELLEKVSSSPVDALIELNDFWNVYGQPSDRPLAMQAIDTTASPSEYYTYENATAAITKHRLWLRSERQAIIAAQSPSTNGRGLRP